MNKFFSIILLAILVLPIEISAQIEKAETIIKVAVKKLGGERYLQTRNQVSMGYYTVFRDGAAQLPSSFIDVISYPDKERTEFKQQGNKIVQTNFGEKGWIFDGGPKNLRDQNQDEIENFKRGLRTSIDSLLRGFWRDQDAELSYGGRREASLGKRNDVVKLTFSDGFVVEFEFSGTDGMPVKSVYKGKNEDDAEIIEEDRFAQFVEVQGVMVPFIVDHFIGGKQASRINFDKIELNKNVPESVFEKPNDIKVFKKELKL